MTISVKHKFVSPILDGSDPNVVKPSNWNDNHDIELAQDKIIGRASSGTGPAEEIDCTSVARNFLAATSVANQRAALQLAAAALLDIASQSEAEAGTANDKVMTPLRVAQAIAALGGGGGGVPVGTVVDYAGTSAPEGWLFCFGQNVSRTTYADLFSAIGTTYGNGDGSTTFGLPDLRGRVVAGKDDMGGSSANRLTSPLNGDILGNTGGSQSVTLSANQVPRNATQIGGGGGTSNGIAASHTDEANSSHNNVQPTFILNKIIFTGVES